MPDQEKLAQEASRRAWDADRDGDYERALSEARAISAKLTAPELRGYRALWHYLTGSVSQKLIVDLRAPAPRPGDIIVFRLRGFPGAAYECTLSSYKWF